MDVAFQRGNVTGNCGLGRDKKRGFVDGAARCRELDCARLLLALLSVFSKANRTVRCHVWASIVLVISSWLQLFGVYSHTQLRLNTTQVALDCASLRREAQSRAA